MTACLRVLLVVCALLSGCDQHVGPPQETAAARTPAAQPQTAPELPAGHPPVPGATAGAAAPASGAGSAESVAGISWTAPARWATQAPRPMRVVTYRIPAAAGDTDSGECAVFFFGTGQGGDVDANLKRWVAQFEGAPAPRTQRRTANGLAITTVDVAGTYLAMAGPMAPSADKKSGYRLLGAIVEAPQGNVFFKFTGPAKTVAAAASEFQALLDSVRKS